MLRPWELQIKINTNSDKPVYVQIADAVITAIKSGKLKSGDALPGSRQLAAQLQVNRNTIVESLDILLAEGWIISKERRGTFVAENMPFTKQKLQQVPAAKTVKTLPPKALIAFDDGLPDSRLAPINELARAYRQIFKRKARWQMMGYSNELGDIAFRNAIVQMLNYKRGMHISVDDICITRGSQMGMYLTAHCLLEKDDYVLIENPGYKPAWQAFENAGARLLPVKVDQEGLNTDEVKDYLKKYKKIRAIYITPHHQFPTTVTTSLQRRLELIDLSNRYGFTIIEDDYDHEFHFGQRPVLPVSSFENISNYVYIGTMSKIVAPALRVGYIASNTAFIKRVGTLRKMIDVQGDNIMEQAILQLINDGEIKRHLKRAAILYKTKRDVFASLVEEHLGDKVAFQKPEGGLAYWLVPNKDTDIIRLSQHLMEKGIKILSPEQYSFDTPVNGLRLGYASLTEKQMKEGLIMISSLL